jgi:peroxiredoxin Q/BCP
MKLLLRIAMLSFLLSFPRALLGADPLEIGADAPAISAMTDTGETIDLAEVYAEGPVLVYFYPKAATPGCTKQACNLRDNFSALQEAGITILGVSRDTVEDQAKFKADEGLPFTLLADKDGKVGEAFQVGSWGIVWKRQSFLVVDGKIAWRDLSASPGSQSADALAAYHEVKGEEAAKS